MALRAIDRLKKAANLEPVKKTVELSDGTEFEVWVAPLTMACHLYPSAAADERSSVDLGGRRILQKETT